MMELPLLGLPGKEEELGDAAVVERLRETMPAAAVEKVSEDDLAKVQRALEQMKAERTAGATATVQAPPPSERGLLQRAKSAAITLVKVLNALPFFAAEVARRAGVSETTARAALVFATVGDYFVPVVFSASVIAVSTVIRPRAPVEAASAVIASIRSSVSDIANTVSSQPGTPPPPPPEPAAIEEDWH